MVGVNDLATFKIKLPNCLNPQKLTFKLSLSNLNISNHYDIWVYPDVPEISYDTNILATDNLSEVIEGISNKKKILYYPKETQNLNSIKGTYCTDFWCYPMFCFISEIMGKPIPIGTMGLLIENENSALKYFHLSFIQHNNGGILLGIHMYQFWMIRS